MSKKGSKPFPGARTSDAELATAPPLPENSPEVHFLRTWFEYDCGLSQSERRHRWGTLIGLVMVAGISGGFWTGVGFLIARLLR